MIEDTISSIEFRLQHAGGMSAEQRAEMQALLAKLKAELTTLSQTNADQAHSVAGYVNLSAHEMMREKKQPQLANHALEGLSASIAGLEADHPKLTELVNSLTLLLTNTGI